MACGVLCTVIGTVMFLWSLLIKARLVMLSCCTFDVCLVPARAALGANVCMLGVLALVGRSKGGLMTCMLMYACRRWQPILAKPNRPSLYLSDSAAPSPKLPLLLAALRSAASVQVLCR